jgi:hypothetical protein
MILEEVSVNKKEAYEKWFTEWGASSEQIHSEPPILCTTRLIRDAFNAGAKYGLEGALSKAPIIRIALYKKAALVATTMLAVACKHPSLEKYEGRYHLLIERIRMVEFDCNGNASFVLTLEDIEAVLAAVAELVIGGAVNGQ